MAATPRVLVLAGGVGGAKLALGLARALPPDRLVIVGNTGDDETFHGLHVSPDLDTLMYTLAGLADPERGWGLAGETFQALAMLECYGAPTWFRLGDKDLATHLERTYLLTQGRSLTEATRHLCQRLGVEHPIVPMSDQPVRTIVETDAGTLAFQEYFVQRRCEPRVTAIRFQDAEAARPSPDFDRALAWADALVFAPSNPLVSIGPVLALPGVLDRLERFKGPRIAVSPLVGGEALRGPAAKMMRELGEEASCAGVARRLARLCDVLVIDTVDAALAEAVRAAGPTPAVRDTIMATDADKERLARDVLQLVTRRIDLSAGAEQRHVAIEAVPAAQAVPLPADPADLRHELDTAHDRESP